jgi:hypothetical protein
MTPPPFRASDERPSTYEPSEDVVTTAQVTPAEAIEYHLAQMEDWIAGRRSTLNTYIGLTGDRAADLARCEEADAACVGKHAEAVRAYAALVGTGCTVPDPRAAGGAS